MKLDHYTISVVIPAFNEERTLGLCLDALASQTTKEPFEVIVVDNNSTDRTAEIALQYQSKLPLKLISVQQKGRSPARRAGFGMATGNIIFSTDADAFVPSTWIEDILSKFSDPSVVAVTGTCKISDCSKRVNVWFNYTQPIAMHIYRIVFRHYWLSGFNFAIRKTIYEKSGGFDPDLNAQEDTDLAFRVYRLGKIVCLTQPPVTVSGRRYKNGLLRGYYPYIKSYAAYLCKIEKFSTLSDER